MSGWLLVVPVALPLALAPVSWLLRRSPRLQRAVGQLATAAILLAAFALLRGNLQDGVRAVQVGQHAAPFGISLVADTLSSLMILAAGTLGLAVLVYADEEAERSCVYHPLLLLLLTGVNGTFLAGDLFNLYVWFEVMIVASFGMLVLGASAARIRGTIKYAILNVLAASMLLLGVALVYALTGTLNFADLAGVMPRVEDRGLVLTSAAVLLVAFGCKAAMFPLFFWLPASYHTASIGVGALFSGLLTKVGVYSLYRVGLMLYPSELEQYRWFLLAVAAATMVTGALGATTQVEIRRILSFHIVSQIGYLLMGLALGSPAAIASGVFFMIHVMLVKASLFLVGGIAGRLAGSTELARMGGLLRVAPSVALLFVVPAASIAGIPPLSGFWAKLSLVLAGLESRAYTMVSVCLMVGVLTLYSMMKIWQFAFWGAAPEEGPSSTRRPLPGALVAVTALSAVTIWIGVNPEPLLLATQHVGQQMLGSESYIAAVRGALP